MNDAAYTLDLKDMKKFASYTTFSFVRMKDPALNGRWHFAAMVFPFSFIGALLILLTNASTLHVSRFERKDDGKFRWYPYKVER